MKLTIFFFLSAAILLTACKKEETLSPSPDSQAYILPQGNNAFDNVIAGYYQKYGSYLLYKFTDRDAYWTPSGWKNAALNTTTNNWTAGFLVTPAEEAYIPRQLEVIQRLWFRFYSDKFLKEFLPAKILLCSVVDSISLQYDFTVVPIRANKKEKTVGAWFNYDNISVNFGNQNVNNMTPLDSSTFIWKVNNVFMQNIITRMPIAPVADFTKITAYTPTFTTQPAAYDAGSITDYYAATPQADWNQYILAMTGNSETILNTSAPNTTRSFVGILHPTKDRNGKIRQRYNLVRNYFIQNYNVDLQAIGNLATAR